MRLQNSQKATIGKFDKLDNSFSLARLMFDPNFDKLENSFSLARLMFDPFH
jgi:hypothetical protein